MKLTVEKTSHQGFARPRIWANSGDLSITETAKRSPRKATVLQEKRRVFNGMAWPHIVFANQRLYVRDISGAMKCFVLAKP